MSKTDTWFAETLATETDECINWPFRATVNGYGRIGRGGTTTTAHSHLCSLAHGPRPDGMEAAHSCHNRMCCNKRHLRWATREENQLDRITDGTSNRGERHGHAKLTEQQAMEIFTSHETQRTVAKRYGIIRQTVSDIRRGKRWSWLTDAL